MDAETHLSILQPDVATAGNTSNAAGASHVPVAGLPDTAEQHSRLQVAADADTAQQQQQQSTAVCDIIHLETQQSADPAAATTGQQQQQQQQQQQEDAWHHAQEVAVAGGDAVHSCEQRPTHGEQQMQTLHHQEDEHDQDLEPDQDQDQGGDEDMQDEPAADAAGDQEDLAACCNTCMVDKCDVDLSTMKPYFRRSKICPSHQTAAVVWVGGEECRFCQQCTRCHPVAEFDGIKRSCRSQLLHHNKSRKHRRRCTPGSFYSSKRVRNNHGVAKKKAAAAAAGGSAAAARSPAAKAVAAAARAAKAAAQAAKAAAAAATARLVQTPGWQAETSDSAAAAAAATGSSAVSTWNMSAAAIADSPAAAAAMPGYNPRISSSSKTSRLDDVFQYEYSVGAAAAAAANSRGPMQRYNLLQQYSADSADAAAAAAAPIGPLGSHALLQGFRSLPNYLNPNSLGPHAAVPQGLAAIPEVGVLPNLQSGPGFGIGLSPVVSEPPCAGFNPPGMTSNPGVTATAAGYNPRALSSSRTPSMTGVITNQVPIKHEDELNPSCSSCSSKGSPHVPFTAAASAPGALTNAAYQQLQHMVWGQQQQQHLRWQQQEQQQYPNWLQQQAENHWQHQQQGIRASQMASAAAGHLGGSRCDLVADWLPAALPYQQQQLLPQRPLSLPRLDTLNSYNSGYDTWAGLQLQQQQQQQQQQQVQQDPFAACQAPQQPLCSSSGKLQLAQLLAQQAAAAAAAADQEEQQTAALMAAAEQQLSVSVAARVAGSGVREMCDPGYHQQQQHMQGVVMQQQGSPNVSAGSTCAAAGGKCSPQEVYRRSLAAVVAAKAAPAGYTVGPHNFKQQQQQLLVQPQQQPAGYGLTPADVVVGVDIYCQGLTEPPWAGAAAVAAAPQGSGAQNPSSNPSDGTFCAGFDRQSSMTSHNAGVPSSKPGIALNQNPSLMGIDVPALAALVGGCLDDADDAWLLDACQAADDRAGELLMDTLGDLGF